MKESDANDIARKHGVETLRDSWDAAAATSDQTTEGGEPPLPLETIAVSSLAGLPVPPMGWHVPGLIPARQVSLLNGDGGTGKSLLAMQLAFATAAGCPWLGRDVKHGRALVIGAEDEQDEMHRRLAAIAKSSGIGLEKLGGMRVRSLAGEDAILAAPSSRSNIIAVTQLWHRVRALVAEWRPALVVLDTLADLFGGDENSRPQARQFIGLLRGLAIDFDTTTILPAHPSLSGIASGSGSSGSTGWVNSVRSQLYLTRVISNGVELDPNQRLLTNKKANHAARGAEIRMTWKEGVLVADEQDCQVSAYSAATAAMEVDRHFLEMLDAYTAEGRWLSASPSSTFAPTQFSRDQRGRGVTVPAFTLAMNRLFAAGRIKNEEQGPPSKRRSRIVRNGYRPEERRDSDATDTTTDQASDPFQRPSNPPTDRGSD